VGIRGRPKSEKSRGGRRGKGGGSKKRGGGRVRGERKA